MSCIASEILTENSWGDCVTQRVAFVLSKYMHCKTISLYGAAGEM